MSKFLQLLARQTTVKRQLFIGVLNLIIISAESTLLMPAFHLVSNLRPLKEPIFALSFEQEALMLTVTMTGIILLSIRIAMEIEQRLARLRQHLQVGQLKPRLAMQVYMYPHCLAIIFSNLWSIYNFSSRLMLALSLLGIVTLVGVVIFLRLLPISP